MSKYGFNPKELRKTIVTQIDKDGFHNRTVVYGKDSGGSQSSDWSTATITLKNNTSTAFYFICPIAFSDSPPKPSRMRKAAQEEPVESGVPGLYIVDTDPYKNGMSVSIETILYKGVLMVPISLMIASATFDGDVSSDLSLDLSENVKIVDYDDYDYFCITGDCEITINDQGKQ